MPTILHRLNKWAKETPEQAAQGFKQQGQWKNLSSKEFRDRVLYVAHFLESRGIGPKDVGCIFSTNCPEWVHSQLGLLLNGSKAAGIYPNSNGKDLQYILNHTDATVLFVRNAEFYHKIVDENGNSNIPKTVKLLIAFDGDSSIADGVISFQRVLDEGKVLAQKPGAKTFDDFLAPIDPRAGAFLIYTSGTTGNPKGALLSHDNLVYTSDCVKKYWDLPYNQGKLFSFLPLCHIAEILQNVGVGITQRYKVDFCTKFDRVAQELPDSEPTLLLCVPRLWEKMMEGVLHKISRAPTARRKLAEWALGVGARVAELRLKDKYPGPKLLLQHAVAEKLVIAKIRQALGLGKAEILASGAAALPPYVSKWFRSLGLEILEDFGQTESTGVICMTEPGVESSGTVGRAVPGIEVRIAEDGEVLCRGRNVFVEYYKDKAATADTVDKEGWLHSGDLGQVDERGLIKIIGRKKDILKTSGGKMVAPSPIEEELKAAPIISQVCLVGDNRKYLSALITLTEPMLAELKEASVDLSQDTVENPEINAKIKKYIDEVNSKLASYEKIKSFAVISREFSINDGEMTPTLKMKRNVIERRFKNVIDKMYSGSGD